jgi:hypothetical protein
LVATRRRDWFVLDEWHCFAITGGFCFSAATRPIVLQMLTRHFTRREGCDEAKDLVVRLFDIVGGLNKIPPSTLSKLG